ncbi:CsgG/HfaB family protein [Methylibium rhizosphaerae]|jgi:curli biogenesis system outer membrane secretion channel CsgG|uniref:CsgG/HfaB family protein n=1 Tax=Methylibium rhizosphaerae TaxID=2570323 RepID=UPI001127DA77|nr:CsgG/HfaB family protein [Methylibium rhizosphaerae]
MPSSLRLPPAHRFLARLATALAAPLAAALLLGGCASEQTRTGGKTEVLISSGSETQLARCRNSLGAVAITESDTNAQALVSAGLPRSMAPLVRQLLLQTRCFVVVDRGPAFAMLEREMKLREQQGELHAAQVAAMTAADLLMRAEIVFLEQTGGQRGGVGALLNNVLGGVAVETRTREALVVMTVVDVRTSEVLAASFGRGTSESSGVGSIILGGGLVAIEGGWLDTPQAKPVAAALVDAWNQLLPRLAAVSDMADAPSAPSPQK